jgi:tetratricopeptide (TPR) repeat protein
MLRGGRVAIAVVVGWCASAQAAPAPGTDRREIEAREAFVTGRYQQALELFGKLYAETLHPTYLRNVGRCYQNLGDPDRAISTFRDYLRKAPALSPQERAEIDGYIAEMEALRQRRAAEAQPPPRLAARPEPGPPPLLTARPAPPSPAPEQTPSRWWLWTGIGVAVAAGVVAAVVLTRNPDAPCTMVTKCYRP